jgi:hypothetical protein
MPSATTSGSDIPLVSIVRPVFNEEDCIPLFLSRLKAVLRGLEDVIGSSR